MIWVVIIPRPSRENTKAFKPKSRAHVVLQYDVDATFSATKVWLDIVVNIPNDTITLSLLGPPQGPSTLKENVIKSNNKLSR